MDLERIHAWMFVLHMEDQHLVNILRSTASNPTPRMGIPHWMTISLLPMGRLMHVSTYTRAISGLFV